MSHWIIGGLVGAVAGSVAAVYVADAVYNRGQKSYAGAGQWCSQHPETWGVAHQGDAFRCDSHGRPQYPVSGNYAYHAEKSVGLIGGAVLGILAAKALA